MINLLPPKRVFEIKTARSNVVLRRYIELILLSLLVLSGALIAAHYFFDIQKTNTQNTVKINKEKIAKLEPVQDQAEELSTTVNTISGLLSRNVKFSQMLSQIGGIMPPGSVLTGLQFSIEDIESPLVVIAQVDNEQKAAILRNNLASSNLFAKAELKSITQIKQEEVAPSNTVSPTPTTTTVPTLTPTPSAVPENPYKFTTVINAFFKEGISEASTR